MDLRQQILEEINTLMKLNYSIDEIVSIIKEKYNIDERTIKELLKENYSILFLFYKKVNKGMILIGFLSFVLGSIIFNNAFLASYFLALVFYIVVVLDYLSFVGRVNYHLSNFLNFLMFFSFILVSFFSLKKYFFVPFVTLFSFFYTLFLKFKGLIKGNNEFLLTFFSNILYFSFITLFHFFIIVIALFLDNILYSFLIFLLVYLFYFFIKKNGLKNLLIFLVNFFFVFLFVLIKLDFIKSIYIENFQTLYNIELKEEGFYFNTKLEIKKVSLTIDKNNDLEEKNYNLTILEKYKEVANKKISSLKNCKVNLEELSFTPSSFLDFLLATSSKNEFFMKKLENEFTKIHNLYLDRTRELVEKSSKKEDIKKIIKELNIIYFIICVEERMK